MLKLISLLHEMNLDQARFYTSLDRAVANKVINPLWNYLKSQADFVSRNGERLFFNFTGDKTLMTDISTLISSYEDPKGATYQVSNFERGTVSKTIQTERGPKDVEMSLGKVLQMMAKEEPEARELLDLYNRDMGARRASVSTNTPVIVISKHPVDIGNMNTNRGWYDTCMSLPNAQNIEGGKNYKYIECDVKQGTLIAYYLEEGGDLKSLKNATGRLLIKPYYKQDTGDLLMASGKVYGQVPQSFKDFINNLLKSSNLYKVPGFYVIDKSLYADGLGPGRVAIGSNSNFKDVYKTKKNKDFSNMDLTGYYGFNKVDLSGANFTNCTLEQADLSGADLSGADLTNAQFSEADLSGTNLSGTTLYGADLSYHDFRNVNLFKFKPSNAILLSTNFSGLNLSKVNFNKAALFQANFSKANLSGANLAQADLEEADLSEANLSNVKFFSASLKHANLSAANLSAADLSEVQELDTCRGLNTLIWDSNTKWPPNFNIEDYQ